MSSIIFVGGREVNSLPALQNNKTMSKHSTRPASRSSITGKFVRPGYAKAHPRITENERIKIGKR